MLIFKNVILPSFPSFAANGKNITKLYPHFLIINIESFHAEIENRYEGEYEKMKVMLPVAREWDHREYKNPHT